MGKLGTNQWTNKKIKFENSLAGKYPQILKFWHPTKNKLKPNNVYPRTSQKAYWICPRDNNHWWIRRITDEVASYHRFSKLGPTCPKCKLKNVAPGKSLKDLYPLIAQEFHPTLNGKLKPEHFSVHNKKRVWWQCKRNNKHIFINTIGNRVRFAQGCPRCGGRQISKFQIIMYVELKTIFKNIVLADRSTDYELDIYDKTNSFAVEIDGLRYHKERAEYDIKKNTFYKKKNILIFRVREEGLKKRDNYDISYKDVIIRHDKDYQKELVNSLLEKISNYIKSKELKSKIRKYISKTKLQNEKEFLSINDSVPGPLKGNSLKDKFPVIAKEFHPTLNGSLTPELLSRASDNKVWWLCKKNKKHIWEQTPKHRTRNKAGCPYCSRQLADEDNNIAKLYPDKIKYFYSKFNNKIKAGKFYKSLDPKKLLDGSHFQVWWQCKKNPKHLFKREIRIYLKITSECPICQGNIRNSKVKILK